MKLEYGGIYDIYVDDAFVTQVDLLSEGKNVKERLTASLKLSSARFMTCAFCSSVRPNSAGRFAIEVFLFFCIFFI